MYYLYIILFALLTSVSFSNISVAALKIGIVDWNKLVSDSKAGAALLKQRSEHLKLMEKKMAEQQKIMEGKYTKLGKERALITQDDYNKKLQQITKKRKTIEDGLKKKYQNVDKAFGKSRDKLFKNIGDSINKVMTKEGITIMLRKASVAASMDSFDFTNQTMVVLNKKISSVAMPSFSKLWR